MSSPEPREDETLGLWIREAGTPTVTLDPQYAHRLRTAVLARVRRDRHSSWSTRSHAALYLAALAASLLVGVILWHSGSSPSWAQVVATVVARPWIHGTTKLPDGRTCELWLSPLREVAASRWGEHVIFADRRRKVRETFEPQTKTLLREPVSRIDKEQALSFQKFFDAIFRGDDRLDNPHPGMQLLAQKRRNLQEAGRSWTEYQLTLRSDSSEKRLTFRVDPRTRLPASMTDATSRNDTPQQKTSDVMFFDYPEQGPADIYALGVPRTATIDDRIPSGELARLYDGVSESRDRFPRTYLAVVTHDLRPVTHPLRPGSILIPMFIWRKGEKWRREYRLPVVRTPEERKAFVGLKPPPAGPEAAVWWRETTRNWRLNPLEICDGSAVYGDTSQTEKIVWKKVRSGTGLGSYWSYLPENQGYPGPPLSSPTLSIELKMDPKDGPPGTVLLIARTTVPKGAASNGRIFREWIDPARSYLVMRHEWTDSNPEPGKPRPRIERYIVEGVAQAPNGVWYPTRVRRESLSGAQEQEEREETWTFSVDFKTEIPDDLFKVESSQ